MFTKTGLGSNVKSRLGAKVTLIVNFFILLVVAIGTYILISQESRYLENELVLMGKQKSMIGAQVISAVFQDAVDNNILEFIEVFDTDYQLIKNTNPPKYHTKYDRYLDKTIFKIQDEFLEDSSTEYAVAMDKNGYLPTHNSRFLKELTGDFEKDQSGNRTKRIFDDEVALKGARAGIPGLLQIYHKDTGQTIWDISSPVRVNGRHWGCFRVGLSLDRLASIRLKSAFTIISIMTVVLLVSFSLTFLVVNHFLRPVRRLSIVANHLAEGKNINREVVITERDEIGELQRALERLRLSMLIALKRIKIKNYEANKRARVK